MMLLRFDPFRELDRLSEQVWGNGVHHAMPMDAYRKGDDVVLHLDLPGVDPSSIDLTVERDVLTISAERAWQHDDDVRVLASERSQGRFSRRLLLGEALDTDHVEASYDNGVLTVRVPVAAQAKPRKVEVSAGSGTKAIAASAA